MTRRFVIDTKERLEQISAALDRANGLRDKLGNPTPRPQRVHHPLLGWVTADQIGVPCYDMPGRHWPLIEGLDGTAALELADIPWVNDHLGKTVSVLEDARGMAVLRVPLPSAGDLATARDLEGDVADFVDDRLVTELADEVTADKLADRARLSVSSRLQLIAAESEIGEVRLRRAVTKRDAIERARTKHA
jgi:hypothetical protein